MKIKTRLIGREEDFKVLYLAYRLELPVLLIGEPGVAKTQMAIDMAKSLEVPYFIRQLSQDTTLSDIQGYIHIPSLKEGKVLRIGGIESASVIVIDEVDKSPSQVKNMLLSVMREKSIFNGDTFIPCNWELFVGTSNTAEFDSESRAFLDRFVLKRIVERLSPDKMENLLLLSEENEIEITYDEYKIETDKNKRCIMQVIHLLREALSDRTLSKLLCIVNGIQAIWGISSKESVLKATELTCSNIEIVKKIAQELSK
jgi:MoxR-like ATPase